MHHDLIITNDPKLYFSLHSFTKKGLKIYFLVMVLFFWCFWYHLCRSSWCATSYFPIFSTWMNVESWMTKCQVHIEAMAVSTPRESRFLKKGRQAGREGREDQGPIFTVILPHSLAHTSFMQSQHNFRKKKK